MHPQANCWPPALQPGAAVALVAPSSPVIPSERIDRACERIAALGFRPVLGAHARSVHGHLAGQDQARAADLNAAFKDPSIGAIWCLRGGAGALRLLPLLDFAALAAHPKAFIGYSDATAVHAAIQRHAKLVSFHGPIAVECREGDEESALLRLLRSREPVELALGAERCRCLRAGRARGHLVGGNLTVLVRLLGTAFEPQFEGAILALEDVNEAPFRVDNMLTQLRLSGRLQRVAGIVCGSFGTPPESPRPQFTYEEILTDRLGDLSVPVMTGARFGHDGAQFTLPMGAVVEMDAGAGSWCLPTPA